MSPLNLNDPLKLLPFVIYIGTFVMLGLGRITTNEALLFMGFGGTLHAGISALNNSNPPTK